MIEYAKDYAPRLAVLALCGRAPEVGNVRTSKGLGDGQADDLRVS